MRRRLAIGVAVTAVLVAVMLTVRPHGDRTANATLLTVPAPTVAASPTSAPSDAGHDVAGAIATVLAWEQQSASLVTGTDADLAAAESAIAADATRQQLVAASTEQLGRLRGALPTDGVAYRVAVIATRATVRSVDAVQVTVWRVGVLTVAGRGSSAEWATVTDELIWERAAWRLLSETSVPGPVPPAGVPTATAELVARVDAMSPDGMR
jgi:hypothetical protein